MHIMAVEKAVWSAACHTSARVNRARLFRVRCEIPQEGDRKKKRAADPNGATRIRTGQWEESDRV